MQLADISIITIKLTCIRPQHIPSPGFYILLHTLLPLVFPLLMGLTIPHNSSIGDNRIRRTNLALGFRRHHTIIVIIIGGQ